MSWEDYIDDERALRRATERELMETRAERDRLQRELDALRAAAISLSYAAESIADARDIVGDAHEAYLDEYRYTASRLDAILRGGE